MTASAANPGPSVNRQFTLAARPVGMPKESDFRLVEAPIPALTNGQILLRTIFLSVDPYMRGRMNDTKSYVPPFQLGEPLQGGAIGSVVETRSPDLAEGDLVLHNLGWREEAVLAARHAQKIADVTGLSPSAYLGVLGMPALTAYVGLLDIAALKPGDVVFVSGAAGAVGSMAGQIAKLKGAARVIGSAGSDEKVGWLREIGFDAAFNYKTAPVLSQLRDAAPEQQLQFERHGYFVADLKDSQPGAPVFNRTVTLRDSWAKSQH